jgi:hypothetical protein
MLGDLQARCFDLVSPQLLASAFKGQVASRHLLVVAASTPSDGHPGSASSGVSEWQRIAQKLQEVFFPFFLVVPT